MHSGHDVGSFNFRFITPDPNVPPTTQPSSTEVQTKSSFDGTSSFISGEGLATLFSTNSFANYSADPSDPTLARPNDNPDDTTTPPLGKAGQNIVKNAFISQLVELLKNQGFGKEQIHSVVISVFNPSQGLEGLNEAQKQIVQNAKNEATQFIKAKAFLPDNWFFDAKDAPSWTPVEPAPYTGDKQTEINQYYDQQLQQMGSVSIQNALSKTPPGLDDRELSLLKSALESGTPPTGTDVYSNAVRTIFNAINDQATQATQSKYGLPSTWVKGTSDVENLKPIHLSIVSPLAIQLTQIESLAGGLESLKNLFSEVLKKTSKDSIPAISNAVNLSAPALMDFLKAAGIAIEKLKKALGMLEQMNSEQSSEASKAKFDQAEDQRKIGEEQYEKQKEGLAKQKQMETLGLSMKIVGPIVAAVATLAAVVTTIASFGTMTPAAMALAAVGISLGLAMMAYSVADSVEGLSGKLMQAFADAMDKISSDPATRAAVRALIMALLVMFVVAMVLATGGGGAGSAASAATQVASQATEQMATAFAKQMLTQLVLQTTVMPLISGPGGIAGIATDILEAQGDTDPHHKMIAQIIGAAIAMVTMLVAMSAKPGTLTTASESIKGAAASAAEYIRNPQQIVDDVMQAIKDTIEKILNLLKSLKNLPASIAQEVNDFRTTLTSFSENFGMNFQTAQKFERLAAISPLVVNTVGGAMQGAMLLKAAQILRETGDLQAQEDVLQGLIKIMEDMVKKFQAGMASAGDFYETVQQQFNHMYKTAAQSAGKLNMATTGQA